MNLENILHGCVIIGADLCVLGMCYALHRESSKCLKELKNAVQLEMNNDLLQNVKANGGSIPYAAITGKVEALTKPLISEQTRLPGVIQERIITEEKIKWIPSLRIWSHTSGNNVNYKLSQVPFQLVVRPGLFRKKIAVEIADPLTCKGLVLPEVFSDYKKYDQSLGEAVVGLLCREHTVGIRQTENILLEGTPLTAVGKLTLENDSMKMSCPDNGLVYYLTPSSFDALLKKVNFEVKVYRGLTIVMSTMTGIILAFFLKKGIDEILRRIKHTRNLKKREEERRLRIMTSRSAAQQSSENSIKCVICLENPVEVVILECGHACVCWNCSDYINSLCPICRGNVSRLTSVFMP